MELTKEEIRKIGFSYAYNAIQTPDGTVLASYSIHDCKTHIDKLTGEKYMVDGGLFHLRRLLVPVSPPKDLSVKMNASIQEIRQVFRWGAYRKESETTEWVLLKDLTEEHIKNIIRDGYRISPLMKLELEYRKLKNL